MNVTAKNVSNLIQEEIEKAMRQWHQENWCWPNCLRFRYLDTQLKGIEKLSPEKQIETIGKVVKLLLLIMSREEKAQ